MYYRTLQHNCTLKTPGFLGTTWEGSRLYSWWYTFPRSASEETRNTFWAEGRSGANGHSLPLPSGNRERSLAHISCPPSFPQEMPIPKIRGTRNMSPHHSPFLGIVVFEPPSSSKAVKDTTTTTNIHRQPWKVYPEATTSSTTTSPCWTFRPAGFSWSLFFLRLLVLRRAESCSHNRLEEEERERRNCLPLLPNGREEERDPKPGVTFCGPPWPPRGASPQKR